MEQLRASRSLVLGSLDAALGVEGLPQSATGQTALFSGFNAPLEIGRHVTGLPGPRLKSILDRRNLFEEAAAREWRVTFANAYTGAYLRAVESGSRRVSVTTYCMLRARLRFRDLGDLRRGRAVSWDVCRDLFRTRAGSELAAVEPREAGHDLAAIANDHDLTIYESFYSDLAGHGRPEADRGEAVRRIDGLLGGVVESLADDVTLVVTSDHGNLEQADGGSHTRAPVPLLALGPAALSFEGATELPEVTPRILGLLAGEIG